MHSVEPRVVQPSGGLHQLWKLKGAVILLLNAMRYRWRGYDQPRNFTPQDHAQAIDYDQRVVTGWERGLRAVDPDFDWNARAVLELGPGPDLGTGLILRARGATQYTALDANDLADTVPASFYEQLAQALHLAGQQLVQEAVTHRSAAFQYLVDPRFSVSDLPQQFDVVVSQAAFEHFTNLPAVIQALAQVMHSGALLVAEVDLQTHTKYLRDRDPLNIYRLSESFYRRCSFPGIPNRVRPAQYRELLVANGFRDVQLVPLTVVQPAAVEALRPHLPRPFAQDPDLGVLHFLLTARRG